MPDTPPKPDLNVMQRIEELLREQLEALGEDPSFIEPHEIGRHMHCGVHPNGALSYTWRGTPILDAEPETTPDGTVQWRFFTRDTPMQ